jgi:hypothetical protein
MTDPTFNSVTEFAPRILRGNREHSENRFVLSISNSFIHPTAHERPFGFMQ